MRTDRVTSLSPPERVLLDEWARTLADAFDGMVYLVGSVAEAKHPYRDVDVRLETADLDKLTMDKNPAVRRALDTAISLWGQKVTGLPIDFQMQTPAEAAHHHGRKWPIA